MKKSIVGTVLWFGIALTQAQAAPQSVRWTGREDKNAELGHVLEEIEARTGVSLAPADFMLLEDRNLAHSHYVMLAQSAAGVRIRRQSLRLWTQPGTGETLQIEARIDHPPSKAAQNGAGTVRSFSASRTMAIVRSLIEAHDEDRQLRSVDWKDFWEGEELVRVVTAKGAHGVHTIVIAIASGRVLENEYHQFPQADATDEFSIPVQIYPMYENAEGKRKVLPRVESELRYLKAKTYRAVSDPYLPLRSQRYADDLFDPTLGLSAAGRKKGYWSMSYVRSQAEKLRHHLPLADNSFKNGGVILEGRYATVNLHPGMKRLESSLSFTPRISSQFKADWKEMADRPGHEELLPQASLLGRPITSLDDAWKRVARRLPDHDPASYANDGFDEIQVYWAITQLFESLQSMGFTDPDLSTRPFHAFLYDLDVTYRDNAFYTDDTINFTTYSPDSTNMARDNTTIWHELGHGVMDRLMGDYLQLADTGGLSEGMADFVAQLVINDVTSGSAFPGKQSLRIFNNTGFYLTNEVHDDGEAYGGTMNDLLRKAMARYGRPGLGKVADLTLETMRLTRNHPALTALDWFEHMLFADDLGNAPLRKSGELRELILTALNGRNFVLSKSDPAAFVVKNGKDEVTSRSKGSREKPIVLKLAPGDKASYQLTAALKDSSAYAFRYPVTVKVAFAGGALQGAIHWEGKEKGPLTFQLHRPEDIATIDLSVLGKCDAINRPDGSCVDYAYLQVFNDGETGKPHAKKRFYLKIVPQPAGTKVAETAAIK